MTDESEYTIPAKPVEPDLCRLVVERYTAYTTPLCESKRWERLRKATRADVEAWARVHAPEWLRAEESASTIAATHAETLDQLDAAIKRAEKAEARVRKLEMMLHAVPEHIRREL